METLVPYCIRRSGLTAGDRAIGDTVQKNALVIRGVAVFALDAHATHRGHADGAGPLCPCIHLR